MAGTVRLGLCQYFRLVTLYIGCSKATLRHLLTPLKIEASETFQFHHCFDGFECAKLKLPIDYFNGTYPNHSISVAIVKLPAKVSVDDPRYGGPVLINPGGPGGSGNAIVLISGQQFQTIIDPSTHPDFASESLQKYYDIIGFDPRGIGWTEPAADCMHDSASMWSWKLRETTEGLLESSDAALGRLWAMTHAFGTSCKQNMEEDGPDIKQYMSTASVARDMLEIAERHAEWAAEQTKSKLTRVARESVKLHYWGFSYGTYLGSTFASMFPHRVGRLVLDGVVNVHDYHDALGEGSIRDAEKVMGSFYTFCALAGPDICALATPTSTADDIKERVAKILKSIYHHPITVTSVYGPELITFTDVKSIIFSSLYSPALVFPFLSGMLAAVEIRHGQLIEDIATAFHAIHVYSCSSRQVNLAYTVPQDAILCGDGFDQRGLNQDTFAEYWHLLQDISPAAGSIWATLKMRCASWKIRPLHNLGDDDRFGGNTSHPILWISNTADPVTPLASGRLMAKKFPGSVVLIQDSAGHCSLAAPTPCTLNTIREYFQSGALPEENTVCIPPHTPLSLNSTDPDSPFYDPSLGKGTFLAAESMYAEMTAANVLQSWSAREAYFGRTQLGPRVHEAMKLATQCSAE